MKRILLFIASAIMASSCLDDGFQSYQSYTLVSTFEYSEINFLPDSTCFNTTTPDGFGYDIMNFYHVLDPGKIRVDGGFLLSCQRMPASLNTEGLDNANRCYVDSLSSLYKNIYSVFIQNPDPLLMPKNDIHFPYKENGTCIAQGCFVTNTVEVADSIKANFKLGDRLTLKAIGYLNGSKTGEADINLADYSAAKDSIVSTWTAFNLTKLGSFEYVDFELTSTNPNIPTNFCMDNFTVNIELTY